MTKHKVIWYSFALLFLCILVLTISVSGQEIKVSPEVIKIDLRGGEENTTILTVEWTGEDAILCIISTDIEPDGEGITVTYSENLTFTLEPGVNHVNMTIKVAPNIMPGIYVITTIFSEGLNNPPVKPSNPSPSDGVTGIGTSPILSVDVSDPDGDTMDVSFYNAADDSLIGTDSAVLSGGIASVTWSGLTQGTTYSWYAVADDGEYMNQSDTWSFTTKAGGNGGNGGNGGYTPPPAPTNQNPVADANGPYTDYVTEEEITFNGSLSYDPDGGDITSWFWDFGDGTNGTGEVTTHTYSEEGVYNVTLTVTDDEGAVGSTEITVFITQSNRPPTTPEIDGPTKGSKNIVYNFSAASVDLDNNSIEYTFDWDDGNTSISDFLPNGTMYTVTHSWALAGIYTITVTAYDNKTYSGTAQLTILIDVHYVGDIGYLIDDDSDGIYDSFYSNATGNETAVELQDNGKYLIDGMYEYDPETGVLALYDDVPPVEDGLICYVLAIVAAVAVAISILIHVIFFKKEKKKKKKKGKKGKKKQ